MGERVCSVDGCKGKYRAKALCGSHYKLARNGEPLGGPILHLCVDCQTDISERLYTCKLCKPCAAKRQKVGSIAWKKSPNGHASRAKRRQHPDVKSRELEYQREYRQRDETKNATYYGCGLPIIGNGRANTAKGLISKRRNGRAGNHHYMSGNPVTVHIAQRSWTDCVIATDFASGVLPAPKPPQKRPNALASRCRIGKLGCGDSASGGTNTVAVQKTRNESESQIKRKGKRRRNDPEWLERKRIRKWDDTVTPAAVASLRRAQKGRCITCQTSLGRKYHYDHIVPIAKNGPSTLSNLQLLCPTCNYSKSDKLYFIPPNSAQGRLSI